MDLFGRLCNRAVRVLARSKVVMAVVGGEVASGGEQAEVAHVV